MALVSSISNLFISKNRFYLPRRAKKSLKCVGKNDLKKWQSLVDDLFQNLFLEMKKLEIEETKVTYFLSVLKVVY